MAEPNTAAIRELNDQMRRNPADPSYGRWTIHKGVADKGALFVQRVCRAVQQFDRFSRDNDPHGEHDGATLTVDNEVIVWKIDYYDLSYEFHSDDAADPAKTKRVLTVMLAQDY